MGSASSKPARKLGATAASKPAAPGVGARAMPQAPGAHASAPHGAETHDTSRFTKDQSILQDARDPQFLQNLHALGAVEVRGLQERPGKSDAMLGILQARAQHEGEDAAQPAAGLSAPELVRLLEEYRACD
ncbi:hypothetical protein CBS9595_000346 [Malassezia furfur]|nr:hypothetical protein CBS9595_000346 [Malassezia furfur]